MHGDPIPCARCGAMMNPEADGRTYACAYCKTRVQVAIDGRQIAAGMQLDLANAASFLHQLATTLSQGFAEQSKIEAQGGHVMSIEVSLEPHLFIARRQGNTVVAQHKRISRGIALKTKTLALDEWLALLTESLAKHANTNARAAWVLQQITGQGDGTGRRD
jgi:hypothetical protein